MRLKAICLLNILFVLNVAALETFSQDAEIKAKVDMLAEQHLNRGGVGLMVGLIKNGREATFSYGTVEKGKDRKPDGKTLFMIGSVTKVFTTTLLARYVEKGLVKLDDPLQKWVPPATTVPKFEGKEITLQHLATHTSGLPRTIPTNGIDSTNVNRMYAYLNNYRLSRPPGFKYEYSNLGFGLLANALARAANVQMFYRGINSEINSVLGLQDTVITPNDNQLVRRAKGYGKDGQQVPYDRPVFPALNGSGAMYSTMDDMMRFLSFNMGVSHTSLNTILPVLQRPRHGTPDPKMKIGLGWEVRNEENSLFTKDGMVTGFSSYVIFDKGRGVGVVILSNSAAKSPIGMGNQLMAFLTNSDIANGDGDAKDDN